MVGVAGGAVIMRNTIYRKNEEKAAKRDRKAARCTRLAASSSNTPKAF